MVSTQNPKDEPLELEMELSRCLRCGFCYDLAWLGQYSMCPITEVLGFQSYGAKGQVILANAVLNDKLEWTPEVGKRFFACVDCGNCELNCAMAMPLTKIFHALRLEAQKRGYGLSAHVQLAQNVKETGNVYGIEAEDRAEMNPPAKLIDQNANTFLFMGCVGSLLRREIIHSTLQLLNKLEYPINVLEDEKCCGYPLWQEGQDEDAKRVLNENIEELKRKGAKTIIFSCPSCYRMFKKVANEALSLDIPFKMLHITELLENLLSSKDIESKEDSSRIQKVAYHDPCELGRHLGIYDAPRKVLAKLPSVQLVELPRSHQWSFCCGGAGKLMLPYIPDFNEQISNERQKEAREIDADLILSACPSCKSNLAMIGSSICKPLPVKDLTELVNEALQDK